MVTSLRVPGNSPPHGNLEQREGIFLWQIMEMFTINWFVLYISIFSKYGTVKFNKEVSSTILPLISCVILGKFLDLRLTFLICKNEDTGTYLVRSFM